MVVVNSGVVTARQTAAAAQTGAARRRTSHHVEPARATPNSPPGRRTTVSFTCPSAMYTAAFVFDTSSG